MFSTFEQISALTLLQTRFD